MRSAIRLLHALRGRGAPAAAAGVPELRHHRAAPVLAGRRGDLHPALRGPPPPGRRPPHRRRGDHRPAAAGRAPARQGPGAGVRGDPGGHGPAPGGPGPVPGEPVGHGAAAGPGAGRPDPRPQDAPHRHQRQRGAAGGGPAHPAPAGDGRRHPPQRPPAPGLCGTAAGHDRPGYVAGPGKGGRQTGGPGGRLERDRSESLRREANRVPVSRGPGPEPDRGPGQPGPGGEQPAGQRGPVHSGGRRGVPCGLRR